MSTSQKVLDEDITVLVLILRKRSNIILVLACERRRIFPAVASLRVIFRRSEATAGNTSAFAGYTCIS